MSEQPVLADVNVWLASVVAGHPHHQNARRWWSEDVSPKSARVVFCRVTQLGLLRLLSNKSVMGRQRCTIAEAWANYDRLAAQEPITYADEPPGLSESMRELSRAGRSSKNSWTDVYLAAFAQSCGFRLATFDAGFKKFSSLDLLLLR